jgi:hypothetical protein
MLPLNKAVSSRNYPDKEQFGWNEVDRKGELAITNL